MTGMLISCASIQALPKTTPEHFTFFGDSLTDTGNFPEPANVKIQLLKNFNLYVPISNPVNLASSDPMLPFLQASEGILADQGEIDGQTRSHYSINWPLYLIYNMQPTAHALTTWKAMAIDGKAATANMNYAWASAVAGNPNGEPEADGACFHSNGDGLVNPCTFNSIKQGLADYHADTLNDDAYDKKNNYRVTPVQVPDLNKQVSFYLSDFDNKLPANNAIFIYIGANDIGFMMKKHILTVLGDSEDEFMKNVAPKYMTRATNFVKQAVSEIQAAYKPTGEHYHIFILTLPHFSNLHEAYTYRLLFGKKVTDELDKTVNLYNYDLAMVFDGMNNVSLIDTGYDMDQWALSSAYQDAITKGKACAQDPNYLTASAAGSNNCLYQEAGKQVGYFSE